MGVVFVILMIILVIGVPAIAGQISGRKLGNKIIKLLDEKDNEWKLKGFSEVAIEKHLRNSVDNIQRIQVSKYTKDEVIEKCKLILENEERIINFEKK